MTSLTCKITVLCFLFVAVVCSPQPHNEIKKRFSSWHFQKALGILSPVLRKTSIQKVCTRAAHSSGCLSNFKVSSIGSRKLTAHLNPSSSTARLTVKIGHVTVTGNWQFKITWFIVKFQDSGRFSLTLQNILLSLTTALKNRNKVVIRDCSCSVKSADLRLSGGGSWLYKHFTGSAERAIIRHANSKFCETICEKLKRKTFRI